MALEPVQTTAQSIPTVPPSAPPPAERPTAQDRPAPQKRITRQERPEEPQEGVEVRQPQTDKVELSGRRLAFSVAGSDIVVRVFDDSTGKLIRQIPPEERLRMAAHIANLLRRFVDQHDGDGT